MELIELKEKVAKSSNVDWYNSKEINLAYPHLSFNIKLEGITSIYEFICNNLNGFASIDKPLPNEIHASVSRFRGWKNEIAKIVNEDNSYNSTWTNFANSMSRPGNFDFLFDNPATHFLINLFNESPQWYAGAYEFIVGNGLSNPNNKEKLIGYILAYEFIFSGSSELTNRANLESKSIADLKNKFEEYLSNSEKHLSNHLTTSNNNVAAATSQIKKYLSDKKSEYDSWFNNTSQEFDTYFKKCKESILEVEELYKENLS